MGMTKEEQIEVTQLQEKKENLKRTFRQETLAVKRLYQAEELKKKANKQAGEDLKDNPFLPKEVDAVRIERSIKEISSRYYK